MDVSSVGPFTNVSCPACGDHTRVKCEFGPYLLQRRHAIGGMSMVFVALDQTLGREVVVKILSEEYSADERRIAAFEEEARITASITHPNVVRVFTTGRAFGRFFIGMEFVTGGHFEHHIKERGAIPEAEALPLAIDVANGLKAAKSAGLIHRDVKPGNILIDAGGSGKLVDFGLALVTQGGKATASELWATPYYVPPEAIEGQEEDFRSDVYAFGASFYHALAGQPPCDEESMDTSRLRKAKQQVKPLREIAPSVSVATASVIDRCMAYAPDDRYASYSDLISALDAATRGRVLGPAPASGRRRSSGGVGEKLGLGLGILAVVGALALVAKWMLPKEEEKPVVVTSEADSPPLETATPDTPGRDTSLDVAKSYREAAEALARRDFDAARNGFVAVRDHPGVLQPTGTWAACEAVACSWLGGRSDEARRDLTEGIRHIQDHSSLSPEIKKVVVEHFARLRSIPGSPASPETGNQEIDLWLKWLTSLKNWDQGLFDWSEPLLSEVTEGETADARLVVHAELAQDYLSDLATLRTSEPKDFSLDPESAKNEVVELETVHTLLKTSGRAPFHVRCWQLDLQRAARREPAAASNEGPEAFPSDFWKMVDECRFDDAMAVLNQWAPVDESAAVKRAGLLLLLSDADAFLTDLGRRATGSELTSVGKEEAPVSVMGAADGGLRVESEAGEVREVPWGDMDPDAIIELHRATVGAGEDSIRRHQLAVAFDLLVGDADRARAAGVRLGEASPEFARRWEKSAPAVDR